MHKQNRRPEKGTGKIRGPLSAPRWNYVDRGNAASGGRKSNLIFVDARAANPYDCFPEEKAARRFRHAAGDRQLTGSGVQRDVAPLPTGRQAGSQTLPRTEE